MTDVTRAQVRHVRSAEHDLLRTIRLASLEADPDAFSATYEGDASRPDDWWVWWAGQSELGTSQRTFVLEADDGTWLGLALVRLDVERPGSGVVNAMWVAPPARGRGAATLLCDACAAWAGDHGCHELTLDVMAGNLAARRAYARAGFVAGEVVDAELPMVRRL